MTHELNELLDWIGENQSAMLEAQLRKHLRKNLAIEYGKGRNDAFDEIRQKDRRKSNYDAEELRRRYGDR